MNKSKLKEVKITNFRNIVSETITFEDGKGLVITGKNELGKTNRISAILWALSGVMFDGSATNSKNNLVPYGANSDVEVSVSLTFQDGNNITKHYNEPFDINDDGIKVPKRTKTYYTINGGKPLQTVKEGEQFIIDQLGLDKITYDFSKNRVLRGINLIYLTTTTLGIRSFDNNTLRALLIDIVGDVDPLALALSKPEEYSQELVKLLEDANGDINKVRDDLRYEIQDKTKGLETQINVAKNVLNELELEAKKQLDENALNEAKKQIALINEKIKEIEIKKQVDGETLTTKLDLEIAKLQNERQTIVAKINDDYNKAVEKFNNNEHLTLVKNLQNQEQEQSMEVRRKEIDKSQAQSQLSNVEFRLQENKSKMARIIEEVKELKVKYQEALKPVDIEKSGTVFTCPNCNEPFDVSETKEHLELHQKQVDEKIANITKRVNELSVEKNNVEIVIVDLELDVAKSRENLTKASNEHENAIKVRDNITIEVGKALETYNNNKPTVPTLSFNTPEIETIDGKITTLKNEITKVETERDAVNLGFDTKINELEASKGEYQEILNSELVREATLKSLEPKRLEYNNLIAKYEDKVSLHAMSKHLLVDTFKELERRIEVKFGNDIWFKLYEPNATDGGETYNVRVCEMYVKDSSGRLVPALANGVSTSMQEVRMVEFIEKLKEHYELPNSVMFIDRLESLDNEKLEMLPKNNQIITAIVERNQPAIKFESL